MKKIVWGIVVLLLVIHQDFWWWESTTVVFGFMPIGLAYHAAISIAASIVWILAVLYAWPDDLENEVEEHQS